jgi:hypothetical protein
METSTWREGLNGGFALLFGEKRKNFYRESE